ncbi:MAG: potassium channel protein [Acidobacteria bacterium]|nr:potassium channel protein [Acidobacteriota bacterium]
METGSTAGLRRETLARLAQSIKREAPFGLVWRRVAILSALVSAVVAFGVTGYMVLAGYSLIDALYLAIMTITTIGYGEPRPLGPAARIFNTGYMLLGSGSLLFAVGVMTSTAFELQLDEVFRKRRMKKMIDSLKDHVIICGFGRVGRGAARELQKLGVPFIVVDSHEDRTEWAMHDGMIAVHADATRDETLRSVGIERARGIICALASDSDNLFLTLSAKQLNANMLVSTRVNEEESEQKMRRAGADMAFAPYYATGARLAQFVMKPHVRQFLDFTTRGGDMNVIMEQVLVGPGSEFVSKSLRELKQLRQDLGISVLAIRRASGQMIVNPDPTQPISVGDHLIVMGDPDALRRLEKLLTGPVDEPPA